MTAARQLLLQFCPCGDFCPDCRPDIYAGMAQCDNCGHWLGDGELCSRWCRAEVAGLVPLWETPVTHYELLTPGSAEFARVFGEGGALDQIEGKVAA